MTSSATRALEAARELGPPVFLSTPAEVVPGDGPLAGLPFAVKDNSAVAGLPTTAACPALDVPAAAHARAVQRLVDAGAVVVGKTNLDQFATGLVGTRSPYGAPTAVDDPTRVSGGSSSGSAVAVALGVVPLALGTDTAGSGRVPAAFNGLVGVKPTRGLVSTRGVLPACRSLDCVTTLTRDVATARAALQVLVDPDPLDPWSRTRPVTPPPGVARVMTTVAVPRQVLDLDEDTRSAWDRAIGHARSLGLDLVEVDVAPFLEAALLLYGGPWVAERYAAVGHLVDADGPHLDPTVAGIIRAGAELSAADAFRAFDRLAALRRQTEPVWDRVDALLLPVAPGHPTVAEVRADPLGVNSRLGTYTNFVNLLDLCAVAVPAGRRDDGLPY
ncbi:MAG: allophanate hydrolase, partial [Mycobacteriales bacterium]